LLINKKHLLNEFAGDEEVLLELRRVFLAELPKMLLAIESSISSGNAQALEASAHALKGAVSNFQTPTVREAVFALEQNGREGKIQESVTQFQELRQMLGALTRELDSLI
jgi:HPt (histidine-containing phosphotransfer) domain-containing protein